MNNIKKYRKERKLKQKELARLVDVSPAAMSFYETGYRTPSLPTTMRILSVLNCDLKDLYPK